MMAWFCSLDMGHSSSRRQRRKAIIPPGDRARHEHADALGVNVITRGCVESARARTLRTQSVMTEVYALEVWFTPLLAWLRDCGTSTSVRTGRRGTTRARLAVAPEAAIL